MAGAPRGSASPVPYIWWALAALTGLCILHLCQLHAGVSSPDASAGHRRLEGGDHGLRNVPAESPVLAAERGTPARGSGRDAAAKPLLEFSAEGPLDAFVAANLSALLASIDAAAEDAVEAAIRPAVRVASGACNDVHPNADDPNMLHVVYASDMSQVEGVQASIASVVTSTMTPEAVTVHIMVQAIWANGFKRAFGLRLGCQGTVTVSGVLIRIHEVESQLIERAVAKVSPAIKQQRGGIDTMENFARFYMHLVIEPSIRPIVVYLDADTIVQADLVQMRKRLLAFNKTVGFVARDTKVYMDKFLRKPKGCSLKGFSLSWNTLNKQLAYNVGVLVVNLARWVDSGAVERVERHVALHNECGGTLWVGGSQPPLLLAFHDRPAGENEDYIVFGAEWNTGDLGWRTNLHEAKLKGKNVLHWNGNKKPWMKDGLYKSLWRPHRQRFSSLLQPYESEGGAAGAPEPESGQKPKRKGKKEVTTTQSTEEFTARKVCPYVVLISEWTEGRGLACVLGKTYGCGGDNETMWTKSGCSGLFFVNKKVTACSSHLEGKLDVRCVKGVLPKPPESCGLMVLTTFFTTKKDWQRGQFARATFAKIEKLYSSAIRNAVRVTMVYDELPEELLNLYSNDLFQFHKVSLNDFDKRYGVNDVRYFFFARLAREREKWSHVFVVDAFDVRIGMNPCGQMKPKDLYLGIELDKLRNHPWMKARFFKMGGRYKNWYEQNVDNGMKILNCGITGGSRETMLSLFDRMVTVIKDPELTPNKNNEDVNLNMAALNYIVYTEFSNSFHGNAPVHSLYKRFQKTRSDVWFVHK